MGHSFSSCLFHCIFSTHQRRNWLDDDSQQRLWAYMGGIANENRIEPMVIGGTENHVHMLLAVPASMAVSKAIQLIKGGSSKWLHDEFPEMMKGFGWQEGYGAFSVSISGVKDIVRYIQNQKEHHRKRTFEDEFLEILKKHNLDHQHPHALD